MSSLLQKNEGEKVVGFFFVREKEIKQAVNGSEYGSFMLERHLEKVPAKMWDIGEELKKSVQKKSIVKIEAIITSYRNKKELSIQKMRLTTEEDQINVTELLTKEGLSRETLWLELRMYMDEIQSISLKKIVTTIFGKRAYREKITTYPASKQFHHAYYAGQLEHLVELCQSATQLFPLYPKINRDVILATCMLHNIGLIKMLDDPLAPSVTKEGELLGQVILSYELIYEAILEAGIDRQDHELLLLKHCVVSQYGPLENGWGSAVSPQTNEAIFFHHLKELSSKVQSSS
ncbi:CMP-binding protein [Alkalihalobacillus alcalophilus ATCC 27647 = CGMCC 1.3604]|uniref:CMP-binding protein n=1 Tax=Alkalihalobacillus alcalophilus ATCC 27647 = CGMCC 1.3604 TaxID=1218173 RepID=A0A4S4JZ76_ALKAL|nr:hypothetical protein [Alkalihalobacillus alcalophilus]MED1563424.1 CMP-binding protein [Alkalihalobacillus alcalophilus]THG88959.1 CMP-binding protein [Alkalihalobacillus alcalophilus ATCC 27647 = CGMCC 1.3604]